MRDFLNLLGGIVLFLAVIGSIALFVLLSEPPLDPAMRLAIPIGVALECLITAAVLFGMAEGLRLLENIARTNMVGDHVREVRIIQPGEAMPWCPQCEAEYRRGMTRCPDCNVGLVLEQAATGPGAEG